ncbi:MAG: hypothetical protein ABUL72_02210, partial [Armatimonadota bacterium]
MPTRCAPRPVFVLALLSVIAIANAKPIDDKIKLGLHSTAGETYRRKSEVAIKLEANGEKVNLEQKETVLVTVKEVKADGSIVTNHKVESETRSVNGEKVPSEESEPDEYTATEAPDGHLLAYEPKKKDDDDKTHLNERMFQAGSVIFTDKAVGKGDSWTIDFTP